MLDSDSDSGSDRVRATLTLTVAVTVTRGTCEVCFHENYTMSLTCLKCHNSLASLCRLHRNQTSIYTKTTTIRTRTRTSTRTKTSTSTIIVSYRAFTVKFDERYVLLVKGCQQFTECIGGLREYDTFLIFRNFISAKKKNAIFH